jgi:hypothetical protein
MVPFAWLWVSMGDGEMGNEHWQGLDKLMKPSCANGKATVTYLINERGVLLFQRALLWPLAEQQLG